jgi:hypothetical protein
MLAAPAQDWNIFKQIFVEHWDGFTRVYPRYHTRYYDGLVDKMLRCGNPDKIGYIEYLKGARDFCRSLDLMKKQCVVGSTQL